jgi:hypothetical protein
MLPGFILTLTLSIPSIFAGLLLGSFFLLFDNRRLRFGEFATQLGIEKHHLIHLGLHRSQGRIALLLIALAPGFMFETHDALGGSAKLHVGFTTLDGDVDLSHAMHMRFGMPFLRRSRDGT